MDHGHYLCTGRLVGPPRLTQETLLRSTILCLSSVDMTQKELSGHLRHYYYSGNPGRALTEYWLLLASNTLAS